MLHERHRHIVDNVLEGLPADAAEEVAEVASVFLVFLVDIYFGAAEVAEHVAHIAKSKDSKFDGIFHIEDGIADVVSGFHQVNERVAHPLAVIYLREPERFGSDSVQVRFRREEAGGATVLGQLRVLYHGADSRISKAHSAIEKVVF